MKQYSKERLHLADLLISIYDDKDFVNYVNAACQTEEDVIKVTNYIESNPGVTDQDILPFVVKMRLENKTHPIFNKK